MVLVKCKKIILTLLAAIISGCAGAFPVPDSELTFEKTIALPNVPKDKVFERCKQWMAMEFKSVQHALQYESKEEGVVIYKGNFARPVSEVNIFGGGIILFTLRSDAKDEKARLTFSDLRADNPKATGLIDFGVQPVLRADMPGIKSTIEDFSKELREYILSNKETDNW